MNYQFIKDCLLCDNKVLESEATFADCVCAKCSKNRCVTCDVILDTYDRGDHNNKCYVCQRTVLISEQCAEFQCKKLAYVCYHKNNYCDEHILEIINKCIHNQYEISCYRCYCASNCGFYCVKCNRLSATSEREGSNYLDLRQHIINLCIVLKLVKLPRFIIKGIINKFIRG